MTAVDTLPETDSTPGGTGRRRLVTVLVGVIVVALVAAGVALGFLWGNHSGDSTASPSAVDIGFARDMGTHHRQAVTMAETELNRGSSDAAKLFAFDINASQSVQLGEMQGWLDGWGLTSYSAHPMAWMGEHMAHMVGANGLMPGMATPAQMTELGQSTGKAEDVLFLQLMIHHHEGGVAMAQYAAQHASTGYVQQLAQTMVQLQSAEITQMEQTLRSLGGTPLPPPATS